MKLSDVTRCFIIFVIALTVTFILWLPENTLAGEQQVILKLGGLNSPEHALTMSELRFSELVAARTNNRVKIEVFPAGQLGGNEELSEAIRLGTLDMVGDLNVGLFGKWVPGFNIYGVSGLFKDPDHLARSFDSRVVKTLIEELRTRYGIRMIAFPWYGTNHITTKNKPIYRPGDLAGLKIRVVGEEANIKSFEAWGAKPTPMSFGEVYLALQTGVVDGQDNPIPTIYAAKFYEVQKYLNLTAHRLVPATFAISEKSFQSLTPEYQRVVIESAKEAAAYCGKLTTERSDSMLLALIQHGMHVINSDREAFRKQVLSSMLRVVKEKYITDKDSFNDLESMIGH